MHEKKEEIINFFTRGNADYNMQSSRKPVEDAIALCRSLVASMSHINEILQSYGTNPNVQNKQDFEELLIINNSMLEDRREVMRYIASQFDETNSSYWCLVKHGMEQMQFAEEVWQADIYNQSLFEIYKRRCEDFYKIFSIWANQDKMVSCGRCLHDMLTERDELLEQAEDPLLMAEKIKEDFKNKFDKKVDLDTMDISILKD